MGSNGVHNLTSESQEVMAVDLTFSPLVDIGPDSDVALQIPISSWTAIPHSGQLNITNSTLFTRI